MKWTNPGHEFDEIGKFFQENSDLYIWGVNSFGLDLATRAKALGLSVRFVDPTNIWRYIGCCGWPVVSKEQVLNDFRGKTVLVASDGQEEHDIFLRLESVGFKRGMNCFNLIEFRENLLSVYAVYVNNKVYLRDICFIPSTKCNLNCENCLNFTPYLKKMQDEPIEELKKHIDLFFSKVDYIGLFHVSGGEPVMYPHLAELLVYIDVNYRSKINQLATTTNGTREYSDELCQTLREHNIFLIVDDYTEAIPENRDFFYSLLARLERNNVWFLRNKACSWIDLAPESTDNSQMDEWELQQYYTACAIPYQEYYNGRLYACNYAHFAEKAGLTYCDETEYLDFGKLNDADKKKLIEFRLGYSVKGYVEFCKKCAGFCNNPYKKQPARQVVRRLQ